MATISTTYNHPYNVARKMASIDHISKGRAGWNLITSGQDAEALNFGLDKQLSTEVRYERAREFLNVVLALWDSWEDGAIVKDRARQVYFDSAKVHRINHHDTHFKVRGPLNLSRPPQGHPIICQAGASEAGWELAAQTADVLYAKAISLQEAQRFYGEMKGRMEKYGRKPNQLKILPGLVAVVGKTEKEARDKFNSVQSCMSESEARGVLAHWMPSVDWSTYAFDEPVPKQPEIDAAAKRFRIFLERDGRRLTIRELIDFLSAGVGHLALINSPGQVADTMAKWVQEGGCDGFNLMTHVPARGAR